MIKTILISSILGAFLGYLIAITILQENAIRQQVEIDLLKFDKRKLAKEKYDYFLYSQKTDSLFYNSQCSTTLYNYRLNQK